MRHCHIGPHGSCDAFGIGLGLVGLAVIVLLGWVLPITLGIHTAQRKGYNTLWMLFGIHPLGGWIAFIVLSFLPGRVQCPYCGGYVAANFRICLYCHRELPWQYMYPGQPGYPPGYPPSYPPSNPPGYPSWPYPPQYPPSGYWQPPPGPQGWQQGPPAAPGQTPPDAPK